MRRIKADPSADRPGGGVLRRIKCRPGQNVVIADVRPMGFAEFIKSYSVLAVALYRVEGKKICATWMRFNLPSNHSMIDLLKKSSSVQRVKNGFIVDHKSPYVLTLSARIAGTDDRRFHDSEEQTLVLDQVEIIKIEQVSIGPTEDHK